MFSCIMVKLEMAKIFIWKREKVQMANIGFVSFTFQIAQILVQSHFELVSLVLALEATEPVSEPVTQMAVELINNHLILVQQKR